MNLSTSFMSALVSAPKISSSLKPEAFLGQVYPDCPTEESPLFNLLASGRLHAVSPWSFDIRSIDCFLLLYTRKGCGKLLLNSQVYSLSENTLLLLDCGQRFRIDIAIAPWDYQIAFIDGNSLSYYRQLFLTVLQIFCRKLLPKTRFLLIWKIYGLFLMTNFKIPIRWTDLKSASASVNIGCAGNSASVIKYRLFNI